MNFRCFFCWQLSCWWLSSRSSVATSHKTAALPLAWTYAALIVYASLYPFSEWRDQGIAPWAFLAGPFPKYWTGFDFAINVVGYAPLGFLIALTILRTNVRFGVLGVVLGATLAGTAISFTMESLQSYLPMRVASNVDLALNFAGTFVGAVLASGLERLGAVAHWSRLRGSWLVEDARGPLVLLALWPAALLFPASVPFGLGQVFERVEAWVAELLMDTPFLEWMPLRQFDLEPLVPGVELLCVMLGALLPCLLVFSVSRSVACRALLLVLLLATGVLASALSAGLSYGPPHAWAWLTVPVAVGLVAALAVATVLLLASRRLCAVLLLMALIAHLSLLNQAPESAYFAQTLATWEQGRFIRFNGLAQWLGWFWPFATLGYTIVLLSRRHRET